MTTLARVSLSELDHREYPVGMAKGWFAGAYWTKPRLETIPQG